VITLLKEGRSAMASTLQAFKFMILYSFIKFTTVVLLYDINAEIMVHQALWFDLITLAPLAIF